MDLTQRKLTKSEWNSIEIPVSCDEKRIIELIKDGYTNVNIIRNYTPTLLKYMKITNSEQIDNYVYVQFIQKQVMTLAKKYNIQITEVESNSSKMKKADIIRMSNTERQINENRSNMFEFVLLDLLEKCFKCRSHKSKNSPSYTKWLYYYYTISILIKYNVELFNSVLKNIIITILSSLDSEIDMTLLLSMSQEIIEKNDNLLKYADESLYEHQKKLFTLCKRPNPKLI